MENHPTCEGKSRSHKLHENLGAASTGLGEILIYWSHKEVKELGANKPGKHPLCPSHTVDLIDSLAVKFGQERERCICYPSFLKDAALHTPKRPFAFIWGHCSFWEADQIIVVEPLSLSDCWFEFLHWPRQGNQPHQVSVSLSAITAITVPNNGFADVELLGCTTVSSQLVLHPHELNLLLEMTPMVRWNIWLACQKAVKDSISKQ